MREGVWPALLFLSEMENGKRGCGLLAWMCGGKVVVR